jgi:LCP family protein required for cell wall assembly
MNSKRRTPGNMAMDGFVRRNGPNRRKRPTLDDAKKEISFAEDEKQPISNDIEDIQDNNDIWRDENTLEIGSGASSKEGFNKGFSNKRKKPHFWQFNKKKEYKKQRQVEKDAKKHKRKKIFKSVLIIILILIVGVGGFLGWKTLRNTSKVFNGNVLGFLDSTKLKGEEDGRVNLLLAGTSEDDPGHDGAMLTDSIMVVSIDTVNKNAFMISIPRDLWVDYQTKECSVGYQGKINAVYTCGEQVEFKKEGYPDGGIGLLSKVVETNFGIPIHYYAKINYTAFRDAVNAVGGIDITLKTNDPRGILDRIFDWECKYQCYKVKYPNGPLHLNGDQALALARARGDIAPTYGTGNDFGRTERQRQMLIALKDKTLSAGILTNPAKIGGLLDAAGDNVNTNFQTNELRRLYEIGKDIKSHNIKSIGLTDDNVNLVETFTAYNGASAVRPTAGTNDFSEIKNFIKKLISSDPIVRESASVVVLNASGVAGEAQRRADLLEAKGINIEDVGNSAAHEGNKVININKNSKTHTQKLLEQEFQTTTVTTQDLVLQYSKLYQADFVVIIGKPVPSPATN